MTHKHQLLLAYYGDDFTGSTDALEFLNRYGIKTILFLEPPTAEQLDSYDNLQAIGVAGFTRSMPPDDMEAILLPAFTILKSLEAQHVHYKVCSTFDSSPAIGSIGRAIDTGVKVFNALFVPLLVAAPALGRYCLFGNLFAKLGIGSQGQVYRLDRHPSMSRHPVTPADESDLRIHLSNQTNKKAGLLDVLKLNHSFEQASSELQYLIEEGNEVILIDGMNEAHLTLAGQLMDSYASEAQPLFSVGSSGVEMALGNYWKSQQKIPTITKWPKVEAVDAILVISGSCSPVTSRQIKTAFDHGFLNIAIDTAALASCNNIDDLIVPYINEATAYIKSGQSVIIHTSLGSDDARISETQHVLAQKGLNQQGILTHTAQLYGNTLGRIANGILEKAPVTRMVIAGGDTSSFAARALEIEAVEMVAPLWSGAPLCKAHAPGKAVHNLEVNIKGGQVGDDNYFLTVLKGKHYQS
ncbi:MAG: four-carbon acid sugar kinase family protein [Mucilaginibacter sp.]|uniref:four-carbon acid sugar kinase family protein n=1 Tax=Mucilaginibacter sp. TaxID=1882438 RepID=UPI0031A344C7